MTTAQSATSGSPVERRWRYSGYDQTGDEVAGAVVARSEGDAHRQVRDLGIVPVTVEADVVKLGDRQFTIGKGKPKLRAIGDAANAIDMSLRSGMQLVEAISSLTAPSVGVANRRKRNQTALIKPLADIRDRLVDGEAIPSAFAAHADSLGDVNVAIITAGAEAGTLAEAFARVAKRCYTEARLRAAIIRAVVYPGIVVGMSLFVVSLIILFVMPKITKIYDQLGGKLPAPTQVLVTISESARGSWYIWMAVFTGLFLGYRQLRANPKFKIAMDRFMISLPIFGEIFMGAAIARSASTLASMLTSGVPLLDAIPAAGGAAGNSVFIDAYKQVANTVTTGRSLSAAMARTAAFPDQFVTAVRTGEGAGSIAPSLENYADLAEEKVLGQVETLASTLEPLMIAVVGGIVGSVVFICYLPFFKIYELLGGGSS